MIKFLYFNGCPNAAETLQNLQDLASESPQLFGEVIKIEVPDIETAQKVNFPGSPTILYNDIDIYTKLVPTDYHYTCRIYNMDGEKTGILSKSFIKNALYELQQ